MLHQLCRATLASMPSLHRVPQWRPPARIFINNGLAGLMTDPATKILISACLLGQPVRFDGQSKLVKNSTLVLWNNEGRLVPVCPEVSGGLPVPRPAAEIQGTANDVLAGRGQVTTKENQDVSPVDQHRYPMAVLTVTWFPGKVSPHIYCVRMEFAFLVRMKLLKPQTMLMTPCRLLSQVLCVY